MASVVALLALAGISLFVAAGPSSGEMPEFRAEWADCEDGESCVAVAVPCGWTAVNGRHEADAELYYDYLATVIEVRCGDDVPDEPPAAYCRAGRCALDRAAR